MKANQGKVFRIKGTNYYVWKEPQIGNKLIAIYGKVLEQPITLTEDILEEVDELPLPPLLPEEDIEEE